MTRSEILSTYSSGDILVLTLEDVIEVVLTDLLDEQYLPEGEELFTVDEGTEPFMGRLHINPAFVAPDIQTLQEHKKVVIDSLSATKYQQEIKAVEDAIVQAEIDRVVAIETRIAAIYEPALAKYTADAGFTHRSLLVNSIIADDDMVSLQLLEDLSVTMMTASIKFESRRSRKERGRKRKAACDAVFHLILGWNDEGGKDEAQIDQMEIGFSEIKDALRSGRPQKSRRLIAAIVPDGVVVTEDMQDEIIEEFATFGF